MHGERNRQTVLVLGANGRLGRVAAQEFERRGWHVRGLVRPGRGGSTSAGVEVIEGDARSPHDVTAAAEGADVLFNAINPPYTAWDPATFEVAEAVIAAARVTGAVHLFPGNLYNYGWPVPEAIDECQPQRPTTRKGAIRVEAERRYREAADLYGVRTILLRAGDFFGGSGRGSWFDLVIAPKAAEGKVTYPGPLTVPHAWAYLPDLAATFERLARKRDEFGRFETFHFPGHTVSGDDLVAAVQGAVGRRVTVARMPWRMIRLGAPFVPMWREIAELAYLWHVPHRLEGGKLDCAIGDVPYTPFDRAVRDSLDALGIETRPAQPASPRLAAV